MQVNLVPTHWQAERHDRLAAKKAEQDSEKVQQTEVGGGKLQQRRARLAARQERVTTPDVIKVEHPRQPCSVAAVQCRT